MNLKRKTITIVIFLALVYSLKANNIHGIHRISIGVHVDSPAVDSNKVYKTRIQLKTPANSFSIILSAR